MATIKLTDATFDAEALGSKKPVLVDFWATWCAPCRAVAPVLEEISEEYADLVTVAKVNVDECPVVATRYRIQSIPTFILFGDGKVLGAVQGALPKARFLKFLETHVPALKPPSISVQELAKRIEGGERVHIFDIREDRDFQRSHLRGARCVALENLDAEVSAVPAGELVVLVCRTGARSAEEASKLATEGGLRTVALEKGLLEWEGSGKPTYSTREEQELS